MHYIIDAYNLFFRLEEKITPLEEKREEFVQSFIKEMEHCQLSATLIFDSGFTHRGLFPSTKSVNRLQITFSPHGISADDYILECLKIRKTSLNTTIVTSDRDLAKKARDLGAKTLSIEEFMKKLQSKKNTNKTYTLEKEQSDSKKKYCPSTTYF